MHDTDTELARDRGEPARARRVSEEGADAPTPEVAHALSVLRDVIEALDGTEGRAREVLSIFDDKLDQGGVLRPLVAEADRNGSRVEDKYPEARQDYEVRLAQEINALAGRIEQIDNGFAQTTTRYERLRQRLEI